MAASIKQRSGPVKMLQLKIKSIIDTGGPGFNPFKKSFWSWTDLHKVFVLQGYAVNPRKNDVTTFNFNYNDPNVSEQFVRNYLWDVIATGVKPVWDSV